MPVERLSLNRFQWSIMVLCWFMFFTTYFNRQIWVILFPFAAGPLELSKTEAGLILTVFYLSYVAMQIPAGIISDRYESWRFLGLVQISIGTLSILTSFVDSFPQALVLACLAGAASSAIFPTCIKLIRTHIPKRRTGFAMGIFLSAPSSSRIVLGLTIPFVAMSYGWRSGFFASGVSTVALSVLVFFLVMVIAKSAKGGYASNEERIVKSLESSAKTSSREIISSLANRNTILAFVGVFVSVVGRDGIETWIYDYLVSGRDIPNVLAGAIFSLLSIAAILGSLVYGWISGRMKDVKYLAFVSSLLYVATLGVLAVEGNPVILAAAVMAAGLVSHGYVTIVYAVAVQSAVGKSAGTAGGLFNALAQSAKIIAPALFGFVLDSFHSYAWTFVIASVLISVGGAVPLLTKENGQKKQEN